MTVACDGAVYQLCPLVIDPAGSRYVERFVYNIPVMWFGIQRVVS